MNRALADAVRAAALERVVVKTKYGWQIELRRGPRGAVSRFKVVVSWRDVWRTRAECRLARRASILWSVLLFDWPRLGGRRAADWRVMPLAVEWAKAGGRATAADAAALAMQLGMRGG